MQPDKNFLQCGGDWLTYAQVYEQVQSVAGNLQRLGVAKGQQIAFLLPNRLEFALLFLACAELGVLQVPLNPYLKGDFLRHQLADSGASTLVTDGAGIDQMRGLREQLPKLQTVVLVNSTGAVQDAQLGGSAQVVSSEALTMPADPPVETPLAPGELCSIMYTSGTTGLPKGCMLSNGYYLNISRQLIEAEWIRHDDVLLTAYQLFHTSGQIYGVTNALNVGASLVLESQFSASRQMARVRETGATVMYGSGAMGLAILAQPSHPDDTANKLRLAMWLPMSAERQVEFESRFATQVSSETYGQTEVLIPSMTRLSDRRRPGTAARSRNTSMCAWSTTKNARSRSGASARSRSVLDERSACSRGIGAIPRPPPTPGAICGTTPATRHAPTPTAISRTSIAKRTPCAGAGRTFRPWNSSRRSSPTPTSPKSLYTP